MSVAREGEGAPLDVVVIGAGPTGLLLAILLARAGVRFRILDRNPEPAQQSRAFALQARSMEILDSIGLADRILDRAEIASGARIHVDGHLAAELAFDDIGRADTPYPFITMIPQSEIELTLGAELERQGVVVERGVTVTSIAEERHGMVVGGQLPGGGDLALHARYVVGADGAHSIVRKALGLTFEGAPYRQEFLLADCRVEGIGDPSQLAMFLGREGFALYVPLRGRGSGRIIASIPVETPDAEISRQGFAEATLAEVETAMQASTGPSMRLVDPLWISRYRVHHRSVNRYREGRGFVAGDAAHIHSPAGGQGMNTGLQDAANLAWRLAAVARGGAPDALLDGYNTERWPVGQTSLRVTDRLFEGVTSPSRVSAWMRNLTVPLIAGAVSHLKPARARAFRFVSQLGIRYEASEEIVEHGSGAGPKPGRRAPDARIAPGLSVFDLLRGYRFTVLAFCHHALDETELARRSVALAGLPRISSPGFAAHLVARSLVGRDERLVRVGGGDVFDRFGIDLQRPEALYLVRPDGYVAWRSDGFDVAALAAFLTMRYGAMGEGA